MKNSKLIGLGFSDLYLLEAPHECCYKQRSDSMQLLPFEASLLAELKVFYNHLLNLFSEHIRESSERPNSVAVVRPCDVDAKTSQSDGGAVLRLRATHLKAANGQSIFYVRRYIQSVTTLEQLGVPNAIVTRLLSENLKQGLVMIGGKAGSGKTTLACSLITQRLKQWGGVCVTAENPIELEISGRHGKGMCFAHEVDSDAAMATAVINFLRTSPNIIFLGEIRDAFVAKEAVLAALSGHLVITTFHGHSIVGALSRFAGFIGDNNLLADALSAIAFLELSQEKDQRSLFNIKREPSVGSDGLSLSNLVSKKLTIDLLSLLGPEGAPLASMVRGGNFSMLSSEVSRQRNWMLQQKHSNV